MNVRILPSALRGSLAAPPSKSLAHRALICAGLADGESRVQGIAPSQDLLATMDCLRALGAQIEYENNTALVRGCDARQAGPAELFCRESGSTLRFFLPLCLLGGADMRLSGSQRLLSRPLSVYEALCRARGWSFEQEREQIRVRGRLQSGEYSLDGSLSSQFVTGLLLALPQLAGESRIRLIPPIESRAYIDMTLDTLRDFGVRASWQSETEIVVPGNQRFVPRAYTVEGDWSNAAFFLALGVPVTGLRPDSRQGDRACLPYFAALDRGCATLDLADCPDLGPVLFAYAASRHGGVFTGTRRLKLKESDRGAAMRQELAKFGVPVEIGENQIRVGCGLRAPVGVLQGHNDHRVVMALSVLCLKTGGVIAGAEAVNKSFPDFFTRLRELGGKVEEHAVDF